MVADFPLISHCLVTVPHCLSAPSPWPCLLWSASASLSTWFPPSPLTPTMAPSRWCSGDTFVISICPVGLSVHVRKFLSTAVHCHWCWFVPTCGKVVWGVKMQYLLSHATAAHWCWFVRTCGKAVWGAKMQYLLSCNSCTSSVRC